jgi:hypothetical protein
VIGAKVWKDIVAIDPGAHRQREHRNVRGATLHALEADADLLIFVRDRDGAVDRAAAIDHAMAELLAEGDWCPVVGGVAIEAIEAWVLAFVGDAAPELHKDPKAVLAAAPHTIRTLQAKGDAVTAGNIVSAAQAAPSLHNWLQSARIVVRAISA